MEAKEVLKCTLVNDVRPNSWKRKRSSDTIKTVAKGSHIEHDSDAIASSWKRFSMGDIHPSTAIGILFDRRIYRYICAFKSSKE